MVTLTMSSFSLVMILTRAQTAVVENATPGQVPADTEEATATPTPAAPEEAQSAGVAPWGYAVIVIVVVVVAGVVVVTRKKKTVTTGKSKKPTCRTA